MGHRHRYSLTHILYLYIDYAIIPEIIRYLKRLTPALYTLPVRMRADTFDWR